ncbi:MAG TPA: hypothetical protein VH475_03640, partial [Tepidisphaeraceae bacterium]
WIVQWELYCNEPKTGVKWNEGQSLREDQVRGFWLVKPDGSPGVGATYLMNLMNNAGGQV